ncbi:hypothetical protein D3874_11410 [Oleomonas cavernae]|uniref:Phospholipase/carboxylesterase/thioesterase domain-containing protein n=1 Tax=Oleomonas cavernae TaxID=2320859 RepID=A0A418WC22_9PROT|nr:hypothetical protein [Oleomonas cavernae]RJF87552.1 hypothetical protein D3874_11410 [Oleomonas cavernae]
MPDRFDSRFQISRRLLAGALMLGVAGCATAPPAGIGRRRDYGLLQDDGTRIVLPPGFSKDRQWPAVVFLPATDGTAPDLYRYYAAQHEQRGGFVAVLPPGSSGASDYSDGERFAETIAQWNDRVVETLTRHEARFAIETGRVALAGFSLGGDLSWALSLSSPQAFCGAVVMGSRCGFRTRHSLDLLAFRGYRFALLRGADEASARVAGMAAARRLLDEQGIANIFGEVPGEHVRAPPETFMGAVDFVLGTVPVA